MKYSKTEISKDLKKFRKNQELEIKKLMDKYPEALLKYEVDGLFVHFVVREDLLFSDTTNTSIDTSSLEQE